jgi:hypothetical protein
VTITTNTKVSKKPPRIVVKRNVKTFHHELFLNAGVPWELIYLEDDVNQPTQCFIDLLTEVMDHHASVRKRTVGARSISLD